LLSRNRLAPSTELIWVASKTKKYYFDYETAKRINGGKQMKNLWEINAQRHLTEHPTEKPEILLERIILLASKKGQLILDPFTGSGTTAVVANKLERNFIGFELDRNYYNIAKNRIAKENILSNNNVDCFSADLSTLSLFNVVRDNSKRKYSKTKKKALIS
jgi:site-specific DNA-methyltransferase (adenine-specific)